MSYTKVDDMLFEMIEPKVKEIESKFTNGQGLTQEDINTLLLKSQYNHINHLDLKLNEVASSVVALEGKFTKLENNFHLLENRLDAKMDKLEGKFSNKFKDLEGKFTKLENKFNLLETKIEATIQKSLNKNMMLLVSVMGFFLVLSKIIDKF